MNKILDYVSKNLLSNIVLIVVLFLGYMQYRASEKEYNNLKKVVIESDSLRRVSDGHYQKLVNDMMTQKELIRSIKDSNRELYDMIVEQGKRPITHTEVEIRWRTKVDSVEVSNEGYFDIYYPNKRENFISYAGRFRDSTMIGKWDFNPIKVDLVISQLESGMFEADLKGNEWIEVTSLKVNSLPFDRMIDQGLQWKAGLGTSYDPTGWNVDIYGGFNIGKIDILGRFQPRSSNSQIGAAALWNF